MGRGAGGLRAAVVFFLSVSALGARVAQAYVSTVMDDGRPVRWQGRIKLPLVGNPANRNGISTSQLFSSTVRALERWKSASGGVAGFDYWQGEDRGTFPAVSAYDGLSTLHFASGASAGSLPPNVLGLTQVWYSSGSGEILEADIVLNDVDYRFTTDPRDTSGFGGARTGLGSAVFIENVLTHEIGHAFGFSHSGGLQSTMLFMESPEQAFLGCDEQIGIRAFYPAGDAAARGRLTGTVVAEPTGRGVFGAHVLAVSRRRGVVLATAMTDPIGRFAIEGLEPGAYFLVAEPFFAGPSALPAFYATIDPLICGGQPFGRTVLTSGSGLAPVPVAVTPGGTVAAPTLAVRCGEQGGAAVIASPASSSLATAPVVFDGGGGAASGGFGGSDRFVSSNTLYYRLAGVAGHVEVHAMSYSLYSPVEPVVTLLSASGESVQARRADNVYTGSSGYVNYDSALVAEDLPAGDYTVRVTSRATLGASSYPAGPVALDSVPFLLVTGSVNEPEAALAGSLPVNGRCRMEENFGTYASPPGPPERRALQKEEAEVGFCGTVAAGALGGGQGPGDGPGAGAIVGWFLPWALMAMTAVMARASRAGRRQSADGCVASPLPLI